MRRRWVMAFVLMLPTAGNAQTAIGKYAGEFLAVGVGGRALGMGGASVATAGDVTASYWNPAGLAQITYPEVVLMHAEQFGNLVNYDYGGVAFPVGTQTSVGFSVIRLGVDDIADTRLAGLDATGNITYDLAQFNRIDYNRVTYFNAADWAFLFTYARQSTEDLSYGGNLKIIRENMGDFGATGIGVDIGVLYRLNEIVMLGANLQDATTTLVAWNTGRKDLISPTLKIGGAGSLEALGGRFLPAVDFDVRFENRRYASEIHLGRMSIDVHSGLEFEYKKVVALRAGYSDVKAPTLGVGVHLPKLNIDYSFMKFDKDSQLGDTHRISLLFTLESDQFKRPIE